MNQPLSVDPQELVSEWVRLHVLDQYSVREILVKLVDLGHIDFLDCAILNLPDVEVVRDEGDSKLHDPRHNDHNDDEGGDDGVCEGIVLVSQKCRPAQTHIHKTPGHQRGYIVKLLRETQVVQRTPRVNDAACKTLLVDPLL